MMLRKRLVTAVMITALVLPRAVFSDEAEATPDSLNPFATPSAYATEQTESFLAAESKNGEHEDGTSLLANDFTIKQTEDASGKIRWYFIVGGLVAAALLVGAAGSSGGDIAESPSADPPQDNPPAAPGAPADPGTPTLIPTPDAVISSDASAGTDLISSQDAVSVVKERDFGALARGLFSSVRITGTELKESDSTGAGGSRTTSMLLGYDRFLNDSTLLGALVNISTSDFSLDEFDDASDSNSQSLYLFSSHLLNNNLEMSTYVGFGTRDIDTVRTTGTTNLNLVDQQGNLVAPTNVSVGDVVGNTSGTTLTYGLSLTKNISLSDRSQLSLGADIDFSRISTGSYSESGETLGELTHASRVDDSISVRIGGKLSKVFSRRYGVLVPSVGADVIVETLGDDNYRAVLLSDTSLSTEIEAAPADDVYGSLNASLVWVRPKGFQFYANIDTTVEHKLEQRFSGNIGARFEF